MGFREAREFPNCHVRNMGFWETDTGTRERADGLRVNRLRQTAAEWPPKLVARWAGCTALILGRRHREGRRGGACH